jgi:cytochrome c
MLVALLGSNGDAIEAAHAAPADARKQGNPAAAHDHAFVAGFARFFHDPPADPRAAVRGGILLLGELNCTACHAADGQAAIQIDPKQAPLLGEVAARANPAYLQRFILDPQGVKPGTTMPSLLAGVDKNNAEATAEAMAHYLASIATSPWRATGPDMSAMARGEELFHKVGCVACHEPRRRASTQPGTSPAAALDDASGEDRPPIDLGTASVPLGHALHEKYSIPGLAQFLLDPLAIRPSGRMPRLNPSQSEALDLANYLLRDTPAAANLQLSYYEGNWSQLPDFDTIQPKMSGPTVNFSLGPFQDRSNFALRYDGFLNVLQEGDYKFYLHSDDGSRLYLDGKLLIDHDGIHGGETKDASIRLTDGLHPIRLTYFQAQGGAELQFLLEGPGLRRRPIPASMLRASRAQSPPEQPFKVDPRLAEKGRQAFTTIGCASCHQLTDSPAESVHAVPGPPLASLRKNAGCLSRTSAPGRPRFALSTSQRAAISAALDAIQHAKLRAFSPAEQISATMTALNCFACHRRGEAGGVIRERDPFFTANSPDLGDEGRIPPLLTGVGEKLRPEWLQAVLTAGATARPYMDTRMPQFGEHNLRELAKHFSEVDSRPYTLRALADSTEAAKKAGRALVSKDGLSCISCHMFNRQKSLGIQAMDLTLMHQRLRPEWFHQYMLNPQQFRPGTRMPQAFLEGKSTKTDILGGDASRQIDALWHYLADGRRAKQPEGLVPQGMELVVGGEAVMYRAFIAGGGTRAIGVGYPEEVNLAFDANGMRPAVIWQGRFIDASKHWSGRGEGFQPPAGDDVRQLVDGAPFARLSDIDQPWPTASGKQAGYRFRGYRLDELRRPTFLYQFASIQVEDFYAGEGLGANRHIVRTIRLTAPDAASAPANLYLRAAAQVGKINSDQNGFRLDPQLTLRVTTGGLPVVREHSGQYDLLIPVVFNGGKAEIRMSYMW